MVTDSSRLGTVIKCTVEDCQFWVKGNYCASSVILVTSGDPMTEDGSQAVGKFGENASSIRPTPIEEMEQSYCYTYLLGPKQGSS